MSLSLISATRYDPFLAQLGWNCSPYFLLEYHYNRLCDAADKHDWKDVKNRLSFDSVHAECQDAITQYRNSHPTVEAMKIRLGLDQSGSLIATASPVQPFTSDPTSASFFNPHTDNPSLCGPVFTIYLDSQPTPSSVFTSTKTTNRSVYDDARSRAGLPVLGATSTSSSATPHPEDVLLYNSQNHLTETTIYNVALFHAPYWITPPTSTGCLPGVLRRWLLEQGRIREAEQNVLTKESVAEGDWILLFNGVQGCRLGRITLSCSKGII